MLNVTVNLFPGSRLIALQDCVPRYELREGLSELFDLSVELLFRSRPRTRGRRCHWRRRPARA